MGRSMFAAVLLLLLPLVSVARVPMDVEDVLDLLEAGVSERVIVAQIEESGADFDLSTGEILRLEKMGVNERIIEAMIRSGSRYGTSEEEGYEDYDDYVDEEEAALVVPSHLGFLRYSHPRSVQVRMVPWSVPHVSYAYVGVDPWFWDPWWWDSYFYVSYNYYPRYRPGWGFRWAWHSPHSWWYWHDHYWWRGHQGHQYWNYRHTYSTAAARESYWKKKTTHRAHASASPAYRSSRYRTDERTTPAETVSRKRTRVSPHGTATRGAKVSSPSSNRERYRTESA
ncbi:MAG: hypothetical protein ABIH26_05625, partial [Candidatus Eisenbacteria bacterium]